MIAGLKLTDLIVLSVFVMLFFVVAKAIVEMYPVPGLTTFVRAV